MERVTLEDVKEARGTIEDVVLKTDLLENVRLSEKTGAQVLPVIELDGRLVGYISRARLYNMYRQLVADFSEE